MAEIQLPDRLTSGLKRIDGLSDSDVASLSAVLGRLKPSFGKKKVIVAVLAQLPNPPENLDEVVEALMGMESFRAFLDVPRKDFLEAIFESSENLKEIGIPPDRIPLLRERLASLLQTEVVSISGKAHGVLTGHENVFHGSRIFSDIRAIFTDADAGELPAPTAAVLVHMLRIRYSKTGDMRDFFVALDNADLKRLLKSLQRAIDKTEALQNLISKTGVRYLDTDSE
jgi:hypothetical protein